MKCKINTFFYQSKPYLSLHNLCFLSFYCVIEKNRYLLPLISKTLDCLFHVKNLTKLDITSIVNCLRLQKKDKTLIVFEIWFCLFKYLIMFLRLYRRSNFLKYSIKNSRREYHDDFCIVYLDDMLTYHKYKVKNEIY